MASLLLNISCGIFVVESLLWSMCCFCCGISVVESLLWKQRSGNSVVEYLLWSMCC